MKVFINIENKIYFFKNFLYFWERVGIKVLMIFFLRDKEFQNGLDLKMLEKKINWGEKKIYESLSLFMKIKVFVVFELLIIDWNYIYCVVKIVIKIWRYKQFRIVWVEILVLCYMCKVKVIWC